MTIVRQYLPAGARRDQILRSARGLFAERGYRQVSTADIARATGVSWALVAHYFGDKRGLYTATLRSIADPDAAFVPPAGSLEVRVTAWVDWGLRTIERNQESWWAAIGGWDGDHDLEISEIIERGRRRTAATLVAAFGPEVPDLDDAGLAALALSAVTLGETAATEWLRQRHLSRDQVVAFVTQATIAIFDAAARTLTRKETFHDSRR